MKLAVVIVSYNVRHYLCQCLESVDRASEGLDCQTVVVDNASTDDTVTHLRIHYPQVKVIANQQNVGFAKANNQAISCTESDYILLLNPDTIIGENVLRDAVRFLDANPTAGGAGVKMLKADGEFANESRRGIPTPFTAFCKMSGLCALFPKSKTFGKYYMQYLDKESENPIEVISGACMFIRRSTLNQCGGQLDEDFFMYGEDIDLSFRLLKTGATNHYLPLAILHYKGESTKKSSYRYIHVFYQAMLIFFRKHFSHYSLLLSLPIRGAIYFRGACAYLGNKLRRKRQNNKDASLGYMQQRKYVCIATEDNARAIHQILLRHHIATDTIPATTRLTDLPPQTIETLGEHDYIIFDCDRYSYKDILNFLEKCSTMKNKPKIATYGSSQGTVITDFFIFE